MELSIKDRLYLPVILAKENSFADYMCKKQIMEMIFISAEEKERLSFKEDKEAGNIEWNYQQDAENPLVLKLTAEQCRYLKESCEKINERILPDDAWSLVEKIYGYIQSVKE